jgi:hypothetical protein
MVFSGGDRSASAKTSWRFQADGTKNALPRAMEAVTLELLDPPVSAHRPANAPLAGSVKWLLFFLAVAPAALLLRLVGQYGVNVPFGDEWSLIPLFAKWNDHQITFADLFRQHNEHRILVPKLLYIAFAQLTHWNLRAEIFFSVFLCTVTSACVYGLLQRTIAGSTERRLALWALVNLFIFSPSQAENWMWGFQIQMFIPTACLVAALLMIQSLNLQAIRFAGVCLLAIVATFSFGNGPLLWPVIAGYLILRGTDKRWIIYWAGTFMVVALVYFIGYRPHPSPGQYHASPFDGVIYFLRFVGNGLGELPLRAYSTWATAMGVGVVLLFVFVFLTFFRWRGAALRAAAPWIALGIYALSSALIAACLRVREGLEQAMDSRYCTISLNLYVALVALVIMALDCCKQGSVSLKTAKVATSLGFCFLAFLSLRAVLALPQGIGQMKNMSQVRTHGLVNLSFSKVIQPTGTLRRALFIHDPFSEFERNVAVLERLNLLSPPLWQTNRMHDGANSPSRSTEEFGRCETARWKSATAVEIGGWACLPLLQEPAPCVVLAYESGGQWLGFALAEVSAERPDVAAKHGNRERYSGWCRIIDTSLLPGEARRISAWAVDAQTTDVFRLPGEILLPAK